MKKKTKQKKKIEREREKSKKDWVVGSDGKLKILQFVQNYLWGGKAKER